MTGIYNVRDYKTPETGDDYKVAIQKAVQAAKDNGGGEVVIPGGHYLVSGPILLEGCSNVTVRGWGARMQRMAANSGQTSFFRI
ncbi:MAG: glycoside hydrolase family 55 protein, partial [Gemmatimonadetes bacterium]|nr:glycoside hydrolase family 55 protein [Gemmatimonadota bacterium]